MAQRRAFKSDVSFLEKISIGATGTRKVFNRLAAMGHSPIELERGSMSYKIWKTIKIKRIRVPDLLCPSCGIRVESRAKTDLEISMSHSTTQQDRGWDYGLDDEDFVALVACSRSGPRPIDWQAEDPVQFISVHDLRAARRAGHAKLTEPKGAQEGFEARITWPSSIASHDGIVLSVTPERIQYRPLGASRPITVQLRRNSLVLAPLVSPNQAVLKNQVLASVVPVATTIPCQRRISENQYVSKLASASHSDRFTAAKALSRDPSQQAAEALAARMNDNQEHIYVRLECAISLARTGNQLGMHFIEEALSDEYPHNRLEAVIALSELGTPSATDLLAATLASPGQTPDIQAGAAWALGQIGGEAPVRALVGSFASIAADVRTEAARALSKIAANFTHPILGEFTDSTSDARAGIAWAVAKASSFTVRDLFPLLVDDDARRWVAFIIGTQAPEAFVPQIEGLKNLDPELYFAVTVLWQILNSWVEGLQEF